MLNCKDVTQLASEALDRRLTWRERIGMQMHLMICRACSRVTEQFEFLRVAGGRFRHEHPDGRTALRLSDSARDRIRARLDRKP